MSPVSKGNIVFFHPSGSVSDAGLPAIVTHVGRESIDVTVFGMDSRHGSSVKECVRHWDDDKLISNVEIRKDGCWSVVLNPKQQHAQKESLQAEARGKKTTAKQPALV